MIEPSPQLPSPVRPAEHDLDSPLLRTVSTTATDFWNDSCSVEELTYAIAHGATGATTNPTIVGEVLAKEFHLWRERIEEIVAGNPTWTEDEVTWRLIEEMAVRGAELLEPVFEREQGLKGRLSIQTDPRLYRDTERIVAQGLRFSTLAPNMQVKIPATHAGIKAIEEVTAAGVSVNATVSFTVPQALAVAQAVERGLDRLAEEGGDPSSLSAVCTIMVGRLDDWLKVVVEKENIAIDPGLLEWAGVAVFKKTYQLFRKRGYRLRLLSAAFRNPMHWSEFIGGDVVISPPYSWQVRFNASDIKVQDRINVPVDRAIIDELSRKFKDFRRANTEDGMTIEEFNSFGPTRRTLRQFVSACHDLDAVVRDFLIPDPDRA